MRFNPQQATAIAKDFGAYALNAGAGSGKTRVITERVGRLIEQGLTNPDRVLILTFTVKAAEEFSHRMRQRTGKRLSWATNFHRLCGRLLREFDLGVPQDFTILDAPEQESVMGGCLRAAGALSGGRGKAGKRQARSLITDAMRALEEARMADFKGAPHPAIDRNLAKAIGLYESGIRNRKAIDFDLMLHAAARGMRKNPSIAKQIVALWDFVLVDEMQDTSLIQLELLKLLAPHGNIMGVGDMDQGIYAFRGAVPENLMAFVRHFRAEILPLEYNYRSRKEILDLANLVIAKGANRIPKTLRDVRGPGGVVEIRKHDTQAVEAAHVAASVRAALTRGVNPKEIAILFRVNAMSRAIEAGLSKAGVTYGVKGGLRFWDRPIVKDVVAMARVLSGDDTAASWERAMARPSRKIGPATIERAEAIRIKEGVTMREAMSALAAESGHAGITEFLGAMRSATDGKRPDGASLDRFLTLSGYTAYLEDGAKDAADLEDKRENIAEVVNAAKDATDLAAFLRDVDAGMAATKDDDGGGITLGTVHSVKGLEYGIVHIVGAHEGGIPFIMSIKDPDQVEEERRLMYVAITRAKDELHIHCPLEVIGLDGKRRNCEPSRFLEDADTLGISVLHDLGKAAPAATRKSGSRSKAKSSTSKPKSRSKSSGTKSSKKEPAWMGAWRKAK
jgi:DNA helicase-2/ATP-dependent DNA helicase PcrA